MALEASLQDLMASANHIISHGETFAVSHSSADSRMASAAAGWTGRSGIALDGRLTLWAARTSALATRIGEQGNAVHACACAFAEHERQAAESMSALRPDTEF